MRHLEANEMHQQEVDVVIAGGAGKLSDRLAKK
jgi:hypothetical protein